MRVLFSTYSLAFQNPGGGEKVMLKTAEALRGLGHTVDIYSPWKHQLNQYDIIHCFSCVETGFWQAAHDQCPDIPLFVTPTFKGSGNQKNKNKIKKFLEFFQPTWNHTIATRSEIPARWLPTTETEAQDLTGNFNIKPEKIEVIPNGVEDKYFKPNAEPFRKWSGIEGDFVLHIGRFHPVKNQLALIRAFKARQIPLVLIGGPDLNHTQYHRECLAEADFPGSTIRILGALPFESDLIPSAYAAARVFVLPSEFETFGMVAFEALAANVPHIFVTRHCAAKPDIEKSVEWIDPHQLEVLALKIKTLLSTRDSSLRNQSAVKIANWQDIAKKIETAYSRHLKKN